MTTSRCSLVPRQGGAGAARHGQRGLGGLAATLSVLLLTGFPGVPPPERLAFDTDPRILHGSYLGSVDTRAAPTCDIGSHQIDQFLHFTGSTRADVSFARVENRTRPEAPGFLDYGEMVLTGDGGNGHVRSTGSRPTRCRSGATGA
jgi:hypothetical protein